MIVFAQAHLTVFEASDGDGKSLVQRIVREMAARLPGVLDEELAAPLDRLGSFRRRPQLEPTVKQRVKKTLARLVIDPDAVLLGPVPGEPFQPVPRRHPEVVERLRGIEQQQLPVRPPLHVRRQPPRPLAREDLLCLPVAQASNHAPSVTYPVNNAER